MKIFVRRNNQQKIVDHILKNVELNDYQKKLITGKWISNLNYMDKHAGRNCVEYYFSQIIILISGALIPILANLEQDGVFSYIKWIITGLGLATSVAAGVNQLFKLERKWIHYRVIAEKLRIEGFSFLGLSSYYSKFDTHNKAFKSFNSRIDKILILDLNQYKEILTTKQKDDITDFSEE